MQVLRSGDGRLGPRALRAATRPEVSIGVAAALLAVAATADVLAGGALRAFDGRALAGFAAGGPPPATGAAHAFWRTVVGGGQYWLVGGLTALAALAAAWRRRSVALAVRAGLWLVAAEAAVRGAQLLFARTPPRTGQDAFAAAGYLSYPSGHAANAAMCLTVLAALAVGSRPRSRTATALSWAVPLGAAAAVGAATVLLGYHWPTDAVAGWALGAALGCAGRAVIPRR
ncbi:phosphatase PAP2 family protein [Actinomadura atramentaria]|uniref:phosphatase PAP2 family protein n=1 Tax=Actinomadura atramentaria TaxID=1990 RepID=UPI0003635463|nr:phosphatase PAP2 family protein [Actinomadura atramentaria]